MLYSLAHRADGQLEVTSFEDIAGAKAYALILPLSIARSCCGKLPASLATSEKYGWTQHVLGVMQKRIGPSEAWCWRDGEEMSAKVDIERILSFVE